MIPWMDFNTGYFGSFKQIAFKVMLLAILAVALILIPTLAFAQFPTVNLTLGDEDTSESGPDSGSFVVTRSGGSSIAGALNVLVAVSGTASYNDDYSRNPDMVSLGGNIYRATIQAGELTLTILITPVQDGINEDDETVIFTLVDSATYIVGPDAEARLTILDDAPVVTLTVQDGVVDEAGPDPGSFLLTRSSGGIISEALQVRIAVSGTASYNDDYSRNPDMVSLGGNIYRATIQAGELTLTILITPVQDGINEDDETVIFTLVDSATYIVGPDAEARLTILDDAPVVTLTVQDGVVDEAGPDPGSFLLTRSSGGIISEALQVRIAVSGTASYNDDYSRNPDMVSLGGNIYRATIQAGELTLTILITPVQDGINEDDETVIFTLVDSATYIVGLDAEARLTILDDAPVVTLTVQDGVVDEAGPDPGSFLLTRSSGGIISEALQVRIAVSGTASYNDDYSRNPDMVSLGGNIYRATIQAGELTLTILITPVQDGINEDDETVIFTLVDSATYIAGPDAEARLTILDDAPVVTLTVQDGVVDEAGPDPGSFLLTRSSSGIISEALQVRIAVSGTASYNDDYSRNPDMVSLGGNIYRATIQAGELTLTILITPVQDGIIEDDETAIFTLVGDNLRYIVGEPATASITIADFVERIFKDSFEDP